MSDGQEGSRLFYKRTAKVDRRAHAVDRYLKLAEAFGVPIPEVLRFRCPRATRCRASILSAVRFAPSIFAHR
jgi:hypothetical protein